MLRLFRRVCTEDKLEKVREVARRNASKIPEYNIVYKRPESVAFYDRRRTGDLGIEHGVKETDYLTFCGNSKELEGASDLVKRAFTLGFHSRKEFVKARGEAIMGRVKRHNLDRGSPEVKIAALTNEIHQLLEVFEHNKGNKSMKVFLKHMIDRRARLLKLLRTWDYKRFEWVLERLNLIFKAAPTAEKVVGRKGALRVLTDEYCEEVINLKLNEYKEKLDKEKPQFYRDMANQLKFIMEQEAKYGLERSVTETDVNRALKNAEQAEKKMSAEKAVQRGNVNVNSRG